MHFAVQWHFRHHSVRRIGCIICRNSVKRGHSLSLNYRNSYLCHLMPQKVLVGVTFQGDLHSAVQHFIWHQVASVLHQCHPAPLGAIERHNTDECHPVPLRASQCHVSFLFCVAFNMDNNFDLYRAVQHHETHR